VVDYDDETLCTEVDAISQLAVEKGLGAGAPPPLHN
jgi:hypothetical protein